MADSDFPPPPLSGSSFTAIVRTSAAAGSLAPTSLHSQENTNHQDDPETPEGTTSSASPTPSTRGRGGRGGRATASRGGRGRRPQQPEPESPPEPDGPPTFRALIFVKDTANQPNNNNSLVCSEEMMAATPEMLADLLHIKASSLPNEDHRPKPCGLPTRVFGQPAEFAIGNPNPSEEDSRFAHHYFTMYKKTAESNAANGQRVYGLPTPATQQEVYTRGLDKDPSPVLTQGVLDSFNGQTVVINFHRYGRYFGNVAELNAFLAQVQGNDGEDRSGAPAVSLHAQMMDAAMDAWGSGYTTEHVNWSSIGMLLTTVPQVTRDTWLAGPPPPRIRELMVPLPNQSDLHLAMLRRSMGFAEDLIEKMRAHRQMVRRAFDSVIDGIDRDIENLSAAARAFSTMIRPEESDFAASIARGVTDSPDVDHM